MSDTTRDALACQVEDALNGSAITCTCGCGEFDTKLVADAILERFLVVPRSDITIEYGVEFRSITIGNHRSADVARFRARTMYGLNDDAARERETWAGPWLPSPLPAAEPCSDCGLPEGRQPGCDTCHGVPVEPAPLPEDGDSDG